MLKTKLFEFDRNGRLTIFAEWIPFGRLMRILKMCVAHARRKKTKKPIKYRFIGNGLSIVDAGSCRLAKPWNGQCW